MSIAIVTTLTTATMFEFSIETAIIILPLVVIYAQYSVVIPQIPLVLQTAVHMGKPSMTYILVEHALTLILVPKLLPR